MIRNKYAIKSRKLDENTIIPKFSRIPMDKPPTADIVMSVIPPSTVEANAFIATPRPIVGENVL